MPAFVFDGPAQKLDASAVQNPAGSPPALNVLYLRDGMYDSMSRVDSANTFMTFRHRVHEWVCSYLATAGASTDITIVQSGSPKAHIDASWLSNIIHIFTGVIDES